MTAAFLQIWDLSDGRHARMPQRDDIAVPVAPFPGVMGTALAEAGTHSTMPPRANGGNMDNKHLTVGSTLYLPVLVEGALFSTGDAHAAQGDGEACVTAVETWSRLHLRFDLLSGKNFEEPRLRTAGPLCQSTNTAAYYGTTAQGPDLYANAQQAVRYMIDHLVTERGLSWHEAYVLCSVAVDLKFPRLWTRRIGWFRRFYPKASSRIRRPLGPRPRGCCLGPHELSRKYWITFGSAGRAAGWFRGLATAPLFIFDLVDCCFDGFVPSDRTPSDGAIGHRPLFRPYIHDYRVTHLKHPLFHLTCCCIKLLQRMCFSKRASVLGLTRWY